MSKKNKKAKSKKNNKKRLAIILSSILGTGILATAITLPIVLTKKTNKDGGKTPGPLDYLDHYETVWEGSDHAYDFDPQLHIFNNLEIDTAVADDTGTKATEAMISNILENYDEPTAQEKIQEFIKYIIFTKCIITTFPIFVDYKGDVRYLSSQTWDLKYELKEFNYKFSKDLFIFSYRANVSWISTFDDTYSKWSGIFNQKPVNDDTKAPVYHEVKWEVYSPTKCFEYGTAFNKELNGGKVLILESQDGKDDGEEKVLAYPNVQITIENQTTGEKEANVWDWEKAMSDESYFPTASMFLNMLCLLFDVKPEKLPPLYGPLGDITWK